MIERPTDAEYAPFYRGYIERVPEPDAMLVLEAQSGEVRRVVASVAPDRETHRYGPGKWSVRQVVGHLIDVERTLGYRAFCVSRGDRTALPGFDENDYVERSPYAERPLRELAAEFAVVREGNLIMMRRLDAARLALVGNANGTPISVRALVFIMAGHVRHHLALLRERYGVAAAP